MVKRHLIQLSEIPDTGKTYSFDQTNKEVAHRVADLVKGQPFTFNFTIQPIGQAFELIGEVATKLPLECSRCGIDIEHSVKSKAHEILLIQEEWPRGSKSKPTSWDSGSMNSYFLRTDELDAAELLHELIASQEPLQPVRSEACFSTCENYLEVLKKGWLQPASSATKSTHSPFVQLKDLIKES